MFPWVFLVLGFFFSLQKSEPLELWITKRNLKWGSMVKAEYLARIECLLTVGSVCIKQENS